MEFISNFLEAGLIFYILKRTVGKNDRNIKKQLSGMLILGVYITFMNQVLMDSSLKGVLILFAQIIYAVSCFQGKWTEKMLRGILFTVIALASEYITFRFAAVMNMNQIGDLLVQGMTRNQMIVVYLLVCTVLTVIAAEVHIKDIQLAFSHQILLLGIMAAGAIALDKLLDVAIIVHDRGLPRTVYMQIEGISLLMLFLLALLLVEICYLGNLYHQNQELKEKHLLEESERKEYEILKSSADSMREWRHDLKSQLHTVSYLLKQENYEEAVSFVDSLYGAAEKELSSISVGNPVLGAVVSMRKKRAEQLGIAFSCHMVWGAGVRLKEAELAALFGNLLDNAVDACERMQDGRERFVKLSIVPCHEMMKVTVENSYDGKIRKKSGELLSVKEAVGHGIGTVRIRKLVEGCGGYLEYQTDPEVFRVHILLPTEEKA